MLDKSVIPCGVYCYTIKKIEYKNNEPPVIKIDLCPYWSHDPVFGKSRCSYCDMNDIDYSDILLGDQCKECGVNNEC